MDELFGAPVSVIAAVLLVLFAVIAVFLAVIAVRNRILVRMAIRNVTRRPTRSALIVAGLMLATAIISIAFTTGDSVTFSIKRDATDSLRSLDMFISIDEESDVWEGRAVPEEFPESVFDQIAPELEADPDIDGVLPALVERVAVIATRSKQFEINGLLTGLDSTRAPSFERLVDADGNALSLAELGPGEVYIDREGADEIGAEVGSELQLALGPGALSSVTVKGIAEGYYFKRESTGLVVMVPLDQAQAFLGKEGLLSSILVSNRGDFLGGEALSTTIEERYKDTPALRDAGLGITPIKSDLVELANEIGSLFVTFFTTFGLFSIGVGLLLIFLIFSMLAAERKGELGMSRAVGMQRRHLVRMFMAEGALYGLGSAVVGAAIGVGLGYLLVVATADIFANNPEGEFNLTPHVELLSVLTAFLFGSILTFVTVFFASRRISRLNIVRAIRDIPDPDLARAGRATLVWGIIVTVIGAIVLVLGFQSGQSTPFGLGVSAIPIGLSLILRWRGVAQRWVLTFTGLVLVVYWLLPPVVLNSIKDDWNSDFSIFFVSGALVVTGAVLIVINNSRLVLTLIAGSLGRWRRLTPILKSAVAYPLRFGFRTGLSLAMFAVVIFSVTVMATLIEGFNKLFDDQQRLAGGYELLGLARSDLNPIADLASTVDAKPELDFVSRVDGSPSVGTFRTIFQAEGRHEAAADGGFLATSVTGVDDDFIDSNEFRIHLATPEYAKGGGFDSKALWRDLRDKPGLAVVNALMVPTRNNFEFAEGSDSLRLDVEGLFIENDTMDPVKVTVRDFESAATFELTVVGVLDTMASQGTVPNGIYTSSSTLAANVPRNVSATSFFFNADSGAVDAESRLEAALFEHGVEALDVAETLESLQASQRSFFNLLIAFMTLGLVVGIVGLGVISARAVVERRYAVGVMRAIGFSRRMVQMSFLAESSFIGLLGIGLGLALGLLTSLNVMADIRTNEPGVDTIIPWAKIMLICVGAYLFSLLTTFLPSRQAGQIAPAAALRYE